MSIFVSWSSVILHTGLGGPMASSRSLGLFQSCWSVFSFTGFVRPCMGRLISKENGTKSRPWSVPHHSLVFHLVFCPLVLGREVRNSGSSAYAGWNRTELHASKTEIALLNLLPLLPHTTSPPQKRWCIKPGGGIRRNPPLVHARRMRQFQLPWICRLILTALLSPSSYEDGARKEKDFPASWDCHSWLLHCWGHGGGKRFLCLSEITSSDLSKNSITRKKTPKCQIHLPPSPKKTPNHKGEEHEKNSNCTSVQQTFVITQQQLIETPGLWILLQPNWSLLSLMQCHFNSPLHSEILVVRIPTICH